MGKLKGLKSNRSIESAHKVDGCNNKKLTVYRRKMDFRYKSVPFLVLHLHPFRRLDPLLSTGWAVHFRPLFRLVNIFTRESAVFASSDASGGTTQYGQQTLLKLSLLIENL